jgi:hypothetical protein
LNDFWDLVHEANDDYLFCGARRGKGELVLRVKDGNSILAETSQWIELEDIKEMYERWTVGDEGTVAPSAYLADEDLPPGASRFSYPQPKENGIPYILLVHGWNMERWEKDRYAETAFKRLYWQGYQGHFGSFRWPTKYGFEGWNVVWNPDHYDHSEFRAWRSGAPLRKLLVSLNGAYAGNVRLIAHSMGNVVAGEALRINAPLVAVYVAMQGALPARAYDRFSPYREIPNGYRDETSELYWHYPDSSSSTTYFNEAHGAATYINFYNAVDYALQKWQLDQNLKPEDTLQYSFVSSTQRFYQFHGDPVLERVLTCPKDTFELFSYCVEGQSYALGEQQNSSGVFTQSPQVDLNVQFAFSGLRKDHSAQFRSIYMLREPFWTLLANRLGVR